MPAIGPLQRFHHWLKGTETKSLAAPDAWLIDLFGATPLASGATVSPSTAMQCPAVRCAVQAIAEATGQLPLHVYERGDDGAKERAHDHAAYGVLHDDANEWTSASDLREQLTRDALLHGNGVAAIVRANGVPRELHRIDPTRVAVAVSTISGEPRFTLTNADGSQREMPFTDVLHIRAPSFDGIAGTSPIMQCREAIGLAIVMEQHAARLFGRGARPAGILKFSGKLGDDTAARIKASWQAAHGGTNSGGTAVLEEGGDFTPITFNSVDAQFLELRKFAIEEIARAFRVPPVFLMDYGRATWANSEEMGRQFLTYTLMPWLKRWEGECRLKLIAPDDRKTFFAEFLIDDLLRADFATRMDGYSKAIAARILNPNEARAAENRAPYDGGDRFENPNTMPTPALKEAA